ncbi:MAG: SsrA-binding protein SmpB [Pseudomonadota bacterium]
MAKQPTPAPSKIIAENRKARHEYFIEDTFEAGLVLLGTEVKSLRTGKANIAESYASVEGDEIVLINANIPPHQQTGSFDNHDPRRHRKLLLHRKQISRLIGAIQREGMTIIPLRLYFNERGMAKLELGLAKGKKLHDKRQTQRDRDWNRQKQRLLKERG